MTEQDEMDYEMRPEYHFGNAVRNPYPARARARAAAAEVAAADGNLVVIEPELFEQLPSSEAVRSVLKQREQNAA